MSADDYWGDPGDLSGKSRNEIIEAVLRAVAYLDISATSGDDAVYEELARRIAQALTDHGY